MRATNRILVMLIAILLVGGCNTVGTEEKAGGEGSNPDTTTLSIDYYFDPDCPNCLAVSPYIDYLQNKYPVDINKHNVEKEKSFDRNISGVPTLIVEGQKFVGRQEVAKAESTIARLVGREPPERHFNTSYQIDPAYCLNCHEATGEQKKLVNRSEQLKLTNREELLPPPSTYSCENCCHVEGQ